MTTRALPGLGAAGLALAEDGLGWQPARCWPLAPQDGARVWEIGGPGQWAELAGRYPLDVSKSRRHEWWRATGWAGRWLIPDYAAVAADWDAVHVSVAGYLTTAGIAIPAGDGARTMLAGWDPDATWWLTDTLSPLPGRRRTGRQTTRRPTAGPRPGYPGRTPRWPRAGGQNPTLLARHHRSHRHDTDDGPATAR